MRIALLGAGFSYNWGGWLAREIVGDLLGRLANDTDLSGVLARADTFEDTLSEIQELYKTNPSDASRARLERMQGAVMATFRAMNEAFAGWPDMQFSNERRFS